MLTRFRVTAETLIEVVNCERQVPGDSLETLLRRAEASGAPWTSRLERAPALLFKGFPVRDDADFARFARALTPGVSRYVSGQTDREEVGDAVYEATKIPGVFPIQLHAEMAYSRRFPSHLCFYSHRRWCIGGASWLAPNAAIWAALPSELQHRLEEEGVRYLRLLPPKGSPALLPFRALRSGALRSWHESLEVDEREDAERVLRVREIPFVWTDDGWLDLSSRLPACRRDPLSGERLWFNQCHTMQVSSFFHGRLLSLLFAGVTKMASRRPFGATFGDGAPFADSDLRAIRRAHDVARVAQVLEQGDVLYFDNLRLSHGRGRYLGRRQLRVVFCGLDDASTTPKKDHRHE